MTNMIISQTIGLLYYCCFYCLNKISVLYNNFGIVKLGSPPQPMPKRLELPFLIKEINQLINNVSCYAGVFLNFVPKFAGLTIISTRDNLYSYPNRSILVSESQTKLFSETKKSFCNCLAWFVFY